MLDAADVLVDRHPVIHRAPLEHAALIGGRAVTEEVPGGLDKGVHRVRLAPGAAAAAWTGGVHEACDVGQRRAALAADLHVPRQDHRKVLLLLGDHPAAIAVQDGNRRSPVSLAADAPVAKPIVDLGLTEPARDEPVDGSALGRDNRQAVEEPRIDLEAVTDVGLARPIGWTLHRLDDRQPLLRGELPVTLILAGNRHDRTGAVAHQDVVGDEERDLCVVERVDHRRHEAQAALGAIGGQTLDLGLARDLGAERGDGRSLSVVGDELIHQRMLGGQHRVGHAEHGVRPRGEDAHGEPGTAGHGQIELRAFAPADPVALHRHDALGPAGQPITPRQQLISVGGDLEEPAFDLARRHLAVAAPAPAVFHLLVGENRLTGGAPVDGGASTIRQATLEHLDEDELLPLVVGGITRRELAGPVVRDPHLLELCAHVVDVLVGPDRGVHAVLDGGVLGGKAEGVPAHRMEHVEPAHPFVAGEQIADRVHAHVAHVDATRRVREHFQAVELRAGRIFGNLELLPLLPDPLPLGLDLAEGIAVGRHVSGRFLPDIAGRGKKRR